mgnify:CR=1 FL=1
MVDTNFFSQINGGSSQLLGLSSGINTQEIIQGLVAARRQPAVQLENRIAENDARLQAFGELKGLVSDLKGSLANMRGAIGFQAGNVFDQKISFASSRAAPSAPVGHTVSPAEQILGTSVTSQAQSGTYTVEVRQIAQANSLRTDAVSDRTTALSALGFTTGNFTINGNTLNLDGDDTLLDLRDKINTADVGVSASIISASPTENFLVLNADDTGLANAITFGGGNAVTDSIGFTDGAGNVKNELQAAEDAIIRVNNLGTDIVRSSNTFDDVIDGLTLDLFKAEPDTEVVVEVENDLGAVKENVTGFVEAFNALKDFADDQRAEIPREEGGPSEFGPLAFDTTLRSMIGQMNQLVGQSVPGQPAGFSSLGQAGVDFNDNFRLEIDDETLDNRLLTDLSSFRNLFEFNFSTTDSRVRVAGFNGDVSGLTDGSGNPEPFYLNVGPTDAGGNFTSANFATTAGAGAGGASDGTATVTGSTITGLNGPANGLQVFFDAGPSEPAANDIGITVTRGIADQMFFALDRYVSRGGGGEILQNEQNIAQQNENFNRRIADIEARVELFRQRQVQRFAAMEQAVLQANSLQESISSSFESLNSGNQ